MSESIGIIILKGTAMTDSHILLANISSTPLDVKDNVVFDLKKAPHGIYVSIHISSKEKEEHLSIKPQTLFDIRRYIQQLEIEKVPLNYQKEIQNVKGFKGDEFTLERSKTNDKYIITIRKVNTENDFVKETLTIPASKWENFKTTLSDVRNYLVRNNYK